MAQQIATLGQDERDPKRLSFVIRELAQRVSLFLSGAGTVDLPGGQIAFPATQNASTDPNTLDDYEEGTWTPVLQFGGATTGITYASQVGHYTKIGRCVALGFQFVLSSKGSATGTAVITGVPFATANSANALSFFTNNLDATATTAPQAFINSSPLQIDLRIYSAGAATAMTDVLFTNGASLRGSVMYQIT